MNEFGQWLLRLPREGPRLISFVLAVLIAAELVHLALALRAAGPVSGAPAPVPFTPPAPRQLSHAQTIIAAHLFGVAIPDSRLQRGVPATAAKLVLAATIATEDPEHGIAIIGEDGPTKVYSVGDDVGGATLHSVYLDHVILDRAGALETLRLPRLPLSGRPVLASNSAEATLQPRIFMDNRGRVVDKEPGILDKVMRTVGTPDVKSGKLLGFRVYPVLNGPPLSVLGLSPGDLVTAVNGTPLDDPRRGQEVFDSIKSSDRPTVTVERQGQTLTLTLGVAAAATVVNGEPNSG